MLVALEALKSTISYIDHDIHTINEYILAQRTRIGANSQDIYDDLEEIKKTY